MEVFRANLPPMPRNMSWEQESGHSLRPFMNLSNPTLGDLKLRLLLNNKKHPSQGCWSSIVHPTFFYILCLLMFVVVLNVYPFFVICCCFNDVLFVYVFWAVKRPPKTTRNKKQNRCRLSSGRGQPTARPCLEVWLSLEATWPNSDQWSLSAWDEVRLKWSQQMDWVGVKQKCFGILE